MELTLDYYSTYGPSGKIYVRCLGELEHCRIDYHLLTDDGIVQSKTACDNELIAFLYSNPTTYKIKADIYLEHGQKQQLYSDEIKPVLVDELPPPIIEVKSLKGTLSLVPGQDNYLVVKFIKGGLDKLINESSARVPLYYQLRHAIRFVPCFDKKNVDSIVKYSPELESIQYEYQVEPDIGNQVLLDLANELQWLDYVEYCELAGKLGDQPDHYSPSEHSSSVERPWPACDQPPVPANSSTPDFTQHQRYLDFENGFGMNVRAVWSRGITGQNMMVHVRDSGVFPLHEDLTGLREISGGTGNGNHGSASAGVVMARNNGFGMTGIAYDAGVRSYGNTGVGMDQVVAQAQPGDVVTMSLNNGAGLPMITNRQNWDNLNRMVSAGVVVVNSASNSGLNLGNPSSGFIDHGDSGVIIVGACHPNTGRRLIFSNFNVRNIVNAWGQWVATCGYGELFNPANPTNNPNRSYTDRYNGTSSAAPMVAGVLTLLQSHARNTYRTIFNNRQMLNIINETGSRQGVPDQIGVRPNAASAIAMVDRLLGGGEPPPPPPPLYPLWDARRQYLAPERVSWNGSNWQALWWSQGTEPGTLDSHNQNPWRRL